jgi:protoporphyrinogen oxidase
MTAKKIVLDLDPQGPITFTRSVKIPTGDGKPLEIEFEFLFRDRIEMAELMQKWEDQVKATREAAKVAATQEVHPATPPIDVVASTHEGIASDVETLMDFITGWNVGNNPFNAESLAKFVRRYPGAPLALVRDYREGMTEGRLGN